jgi:hypothetical protein
MSKTPQQKQPTTKPKSLRKKSISLVTKTFSAFFSSKYLNNKYVEGFKMILGCVCCFSLVAVAFYGNNYYFIYYIITLLIIIYLIGIANRWCILQTTPVVTFILLSVALILLAYVEALHYACVAVERWDMPSYEEKFPRAVKCWRLVDNPEKVKKFLVGRQFFVIFVVFLIAQITSFPGLPDDFLSLPKIILVLVIGTGLPGIAITLTFGQLISQIYVEEYTIQFLNLYGCEFVIQLSLWTEYIGVCNFSWLLYHLSSRYFY